MKIEKIQKLKNNKYKIKLDSGDIINTYDDVILNNSLLFNKEIDLELLNNDSNQRDFSKAIKQYQKTASIADANKSASFRSLKQRMISYGL